MPIIYYLFVQCWKLYKESSFEYYEMIFHKAHSGFLGFDHTPTKSISHNAQRMIIYSLNKLKVNVYMLFYVSRPWQWNFFL